jgi:hypothetical protein
MRKAPPPFSPRIYGDLQIFPSPTADPAAAIITPILLPKESLFEKSNPLIFIVQFYLYSARLSKNGKKLPC